MWVHLQNSKHTIGWTGSMWIEVESLFIHIRGYRGSASIDVNQEQIDWQPAVITILSWGQGGGGGRRGPPHLLMWQAHLHVQSGQDQNAWSSRDERQTLVSNATNESLSRSRYLYPSVSPTPLSVPLSLPHPSPVPFDLFLHIHTFISISLIKRRV